MKVVNDVDFDLKKILFLYINLNFLESRQQRKERHQKRRGERVDHKSRSQEKKCEEDEEHRERLERSKHRYESARVKTAAAGNKQVEV